MKISLISSQENEELLFDFEQNTSLDEIIVGSSSFLKVKENGFFFEKALDVKKKKKIPKKPRMNRPKKKIK